MQLEITRNPKYEIAISKPRNRMYLKVIGYWASPADAPNYKADLQRAMRQLTPGFTILTDASQMVPHDKSLMPVHEACQRMLVEGGLSRTAEVVPTTLTKIHVRRISEASGMRKGSFATPEEAETWLDTPEG